MSNDDKRPNKIFPRNLTARAAYNVVGNPANTRLESGVGNCFPGLEVDLRNLDRRFFPGLLFNFVPAALFPVPETPPDVQGARLLYPDFLHDPMLSPESPEQWVQDLLTAYRGTIGSVLSEGRWYLDWVEQRGRRLLMSDGNGIPYDGKWVWRFIRSLEPDCLLKIGLLRRDSAPAGAPRFVELVGKRRSYVNPAGVIDASYRPGELTQSLCNPWTHDFRDCGCHYWPSNHPDVVMGQVVQGYTLPDGESANPELAETYLDWLRSDRSPERSAGVYNTMDQNRPYQLDHYEINRAWEELPFVLHGREIGDDYQPEEEKPAEPYSSAEEMINELETVLAPMEMALAIQYLYAYFSLCEPEEVAKSRWSTLAEDVIFARRSILMVAVGEMTHLRWANQILWELYKTGFFPQGKKYEPVVEAAQTLRYYRLDDQPAPRLLRRLTPDTLQDFISIERPGGDIETAYARCVVTLEQPHYPTHIYELAVRIDTDGMDHYSRFNYVAQVLKGYEGAVPPYPYLRELTNSSSRAKRALSLFTAIIKGLKAAYRAEADENYTQAERHIRFVRTTMDRLRLEADRLGRKGIGIPFWEDEPV